MKPNILYCLLFTIFPLTLAWGQKAPSNNNKIDMLPELSTNCPFVENSNLDGLIDDEEKEVMEFCIVNKLTTAEEIASSIIGAWELVGHGEGWIPSFSQPCINLEFTESELALEFKNEGIDTTATYTWKVLSGVAGPSLIITPKPFAGAGFSIICSEYMFSDYTPSDGNMYLYQKIQNTATVIADAGPDKILNCLETSVTLGSDSTTTGTAIIYEWTSGSGSPIIGGDTSSLIVTVPGYYFLSVTNTGTGEVDLDTVFVAEDIKKPIVFLFGTSTINCAFDPITIDASVQGELENQFAYQWSTNNGNIIEGDTTPSITVDAIGDYTLVVTNTVNGCTSGISTSFVSDVSAGSLASYFATCEVDNLIIGEMPFSTNPDTSCTYIWSTENGMIVGDTIGFTTEIASFGRYVRLCSMDNSNCDRAQFFTIAPKLYGNAGPDQTLSCDSSSTVVLGDALTSSALTIFYTWYFNNTMVGSNKFLEVSEPGWYTLEVWDVDGCIIRDAVQVSADGEIEEVIIEVEDEAMDSCGVSLVQLSIGNLSDFPNYEFAWILPGGEIAQELSVRADQLGDYILSYTNLESGCLGVSIFSNTFDPEDLLSVSTESTDVSCFGENDGIIDLAIEGGVPPYTIAGILSGAKNLPAGLYTFSVTDNVGCAIQSEVEITEPLPLSLIFGVSTDGFFKVLANGGTRPYTYLWDNNITTPCIENPVSGTIYTVQVTDANGCVISEEGLFTTVSVAAQVNVSVNCFPNPNKGTFSIEGDNVDPQSIQIYNLQGMLVAHKLIFQSSDMTTLKLDNNIKGAYIIKVDVEGKSFVEKVIVL